AAELARWKIEPDDSGGRPLSLTAPGVYVSLLSETVLSGFAPGTLLSLLKHPIAAAEHPRGLHLRLTRRLERSVLRARRPGKGLDALREAVAMAEMRGETAELDEVDAQTVEPTSAEQETAAFQPWFERVAEILQPFVELAEKDEVTFADLLDAHATAARRLSLRDDPEAPPELFERAAGEAMADFFDRLSRDATAFGPIAPREYPALLGQLMAGEAVREAFGRHPRVMILGPLEARMQTADIVVLAGLNEGVWPQMPDPDPWISRDMRARLGLPPLESRIGLSAHDFFQAAMAGTAILTRSRKKDGAPTVPSRWLLRIENLLAGVAPETLDAMRARGERYARLVEEMDPALPSTGSLAPQPRPAPCPPVAARPRAFSVTEVETLIRDPYAIYAKKVLRLRPMPDLVEEPDARDRGTLLHRIVERYVRATLREVPDDPAALYDRIVETVLGEIADWPTQAAFWQARAHQIRPWFLSTEAERRSAGAPVALEGSGRLKFEAILGDVALSATADRIDRLSDGSYAIYDYKTGSVPSGRQQTVFAKQLPLEAAILNAGGFDALPAGPVSVLSYLALTGGSSGGVEKPFVGEKRGPEAEAAAAIEGFAKLMAAYSLETQSYPSRLRPDSISFEGDYDHLARLGEWAEGGLDDG
ncbi:MAG: double-strand break repair protein AddB, partial [Pseudomonadota bacterium]